MLFFALTSNAGTVWCPCPRGGTPTDWLVLFIVTVGVPAALMVGGVWWSARMGTAEEPVEDEELPEPPPRWAGDD